jgi:hypothetical protein
MRRSLGELLFFWSILYPDVLFSVFTPFVFGQDFKVSGWDCYYSMHHHVLHVLGTWILLLGASYE